jgi:hypothetical protein
MQKKLSWQVFSNDDRNEVIEAVKNTISNSDGCIMNFNMFSDLALTLSVEIEENKIQTLHRALSRVVNVSKLEVHNINLESKKEWLIFMNISFGKGKGELKQEIPE